jgi:hypothetical protein
MLLLPRFRSQRRGFSPYRRHLLQIRRSRQVLNWPGPLPHGEWGADISERCDLSPDRGQALRNHGPPHQVLGTGKPLDKFTLAEALRGSPVAGQQKRGTKLNATLQLGFRKL